MNPKLGQILHFKKEADGELKEETLALSGIGTTDTHITLDANHPLAGKNLHFEIELLKIL